MATGLTRGQTLSILLAIVGLSGAAVIAIATPWIGGEKRLFVGAGLIFAGALVALVVFLVKSPRRQVDSGRDAEEATVEVELVVEEPTHGPERNARTVPKRFEFLDMQPGMAREMAVLGFLREPVGLPEAQIAASIDDLEAVLGAENCTWEDFAHFLCKKHPLSEVLKHCPAVSDDAACSRAYRSLDFEHEDGRLKRRGLLMLEAAFLTHWEPKTGAQAAN